MASASISRRGHFSIQGDVDEMFGYYAREIRAEFKRSGKRCGGCSQESHFSGQEIDIGENPPYGCFTIEEKLLNPRIDSHNCVFRTPNPEVLKQLMRIVPERNQIYFLEENREVLQRDKGDPPR